MQWATCLLKYTNKVNRQQPGAAAISSPLVAAALVAAFRAADLERLGCGSAALEKLATTRARSAHAQVEKWIRYPTWQACDANNADNRRYRIFRTAGERQAYAKSCLAPTMRPPGKNLDI